MASVIPIKEITKASRTAALMTNARVNARRDTALSATWITSCCTPPGLSGRSSVRT